MNRFGRFCSSLTKMKHAKLTTKQLFPQLYELESQKRQSLRAETASRAKKEGLLLFFTVNVAILDIYLWWRVCATWRVGCEFPPWCLLREQTTSCLPTLHVSSAQLLLSYKHNTPVDLRQSLVINTSICLCWTSNFLAVLQLVFPLTNVFFFLIIYTVAI